MNLYHLSTFLAVARSQSFTQAANELHLTQPTVSSGVSELERSLGVKLFNRIGRSISLTMEGRLLESYAEQIADLTTEAEDRIHSRCRGPSIGVQATRSPARDTPAGL